MIVVYCLFLHFLGDFILQPREMGRKKSSDMKYWAAHVGIQILTFLFGLWYFVGPDMALKIAVANGLIHGLIDAFIWKGYALSVWKRRRGIAIRNNWNEKSEVFSQLSTRPKEAAAYLKKNFKYWEDHWFYATIGLDQMLHTVTIVLLLEYL